MFSTTTIASSTTKPVAIVKAISEMLSRLKFSTYIIANEPSQSQHDDGAARDQRGPQVAQKHEDDQHDEDDGERERELHISAPRREW